MDLLNLAPRPDPLLRQEVSGVHFAFERVQDAPLVDALVDRAFGPGRYAKAAERLREGATLRRDLSVCAWAGDSLVGVARQWPIRIGAVGCLFLGPLAVEEAQRRRGLGGALIERALEAAQRAGERLVLLVGDRSYFEPFGFVAAPPGRVVMPGPVHPQRLLWRPLAPGALEGVEGRAVHTEA